MACIYPSQIISDIRKSVETSAPWKKREIRFPGNVIPPIAVEPSPGTQRVSRLEVPVWCSSCGDELPKGLSVIAFWYDVHPGLPTSSPAKNWIHINKCKHTEGAP